MNRDSLRGIPGEISNCVSDFPKREPCGEELADFEEHLLDFPVWN
jgi:hypothetical protein